MWSQEEWVGTLRLAKTQPKPNQNKKPNSHWFAGQNWRENWPEISFVVKIVNSFVWWFFFLENQSHWNRSASNKLQSSDRKVETQMVPCQLSQWGAENPRLPSTATLSWYSRSWGLSAPCKRTRIQEDGFPVGIPKLWSRSWYQDLPGAQALELARTLVN